MTSDAVERLPLADPTVPVDPETAARALGALLAEEHAASIVGLESCALAAYATRLHEAATRLDDQPLSSGPYLGRSLHDLARLGVETVEALPPSDDPPAPVRLGLSAATVFLGRDGKLTIEGDPVAGDRHLDLARAAAGLGGRFGPAVVAPLLDAYGIDRIDLRRLDTGQLLAGVADGIAAVEAST